MHFYDFLLVLIGHYALLWVLLGSYKSYASLCVVMGPYRSLSIFMVRVYLFLQVLMNFYGF